MNKREKIGSRIDRIIRFFADLSTIASLFITTNFISALGGLALVGLGADAFQARFASTEPVLAIFASPVSEIIGWIMFATGLSVLSVFTFYKFWDRRRYDLHPEGAASFSIPRRLARKADRKNITVTRDDIDPEKCVLKSANSAFGDAFNMEVRRFLNRSMRVSRDALINSVVFASPKGKSREEILKFDCKLSDCMARVLNKRKEANIWIDVRPAKRDEEDVPAVRYRMTYKYRPHWLLGDRIYVFITKIGRRKGQIPMI